VRQFSWFGKSMTISFMPLFASFHEFLILSHTGRFFRELQRFSMPLSRKSGRRLMKKEIITAMMAVPMLT
jgi:hypothetical protein